MQNSRLCKSFWSHDIDGLRLPERMPNMHRNATADLPDEAHRLGYARVSPYGQTLHAQLEQLRANGCANIYWKM
jgi:hypothetical protein